MLIIPDSGRWNLEACGPLTKSVSQIELRLTENWDSRCPGLSSNMLWEERATKSTSMANELENVCRPPAEKQSIAEVFAIQVSVASTIIDVTKSALLLI